FRVTIWSPNCLFLTEKAQLTFQLLQIGPEATKGLFPSDSSLGTDFQDDRLGILGGLVKGGKILGFYLIPLLIILWLNR
ncbi:hypothetical protein LINPERHAP2_LOCUS41270, partial [Linum perenne]